MSHTGLSPATAALPNAFCCLPFVTGLVRVRSPLLTESRLMSFPPGTEMFQFPGFASPHLCIQWVITSAPSTGPGPKPGNDR